MASKLTAAGRRGLVLVVVAFIAASFSVSGASASPAKDARVQQMMGLWDGPG